jgi:hypothetical protein
MPHYTMSWSAIIREPYSLLRHMLLTLLMGLTTLYIYEGQGWGLFLLSFPLQFVLGVVGIAITPNNTMDWSVITGLFSEHAVVLRHIVVTLLVLLVTLYLCESYDIGFTATVLLQLFVGLSLQMLFLLRSWATGDLDQLAALLGGQAARLKDAHTMTGHRGVSDLEIIQLRAKPGSHDFSKV